MALFKKKTESAEIEEISLEDLSLDYNENDQEDEEVKQDEKSEDEFDPNGIQMVVERIESGLVGTLLIKDDNINKPLFKNGDLVHFKQAFRFQKKDFVLYFSHDKYYIRRIIKFVDDEIYVAGDNETSYHVIRKEDIVGKAIRRQRKNKFLSLSLNPKKKLYTFFKYNLAFVRLGKRITDYEMEVNSSALENAMLNFGQQQNQQNQKVEKPVYSTEGIDLDSDLASFMDPDELVYELRRAEKEANINQSEEEEYEEEVEYVEEEVEETEEQAESEEDEVEVIDI